MNLYVVNVRTDFDMVVAAKDVNEARWIASDSWNEEANNIDLHFYTYVSNPKLIRSADDLPDYITPDHTAYTSDDRVHTIREFLPTTESAGEPREP